MTIKKINSVQVLNVDIAELYQKEIVQIKKL